VFIDCPSINQKAFTKQFESFVTGMKIVAEHKADAKYPVVSAASIIAKVTRDTEIERLKKVVGMDFGSGYPADPKTQEFLKNNWNNPDPKVQALFRKSWASFKTASQKKMDDYFA
jgi:ribonuclease HII